MVPYSIMTNYSSMTTNTTNNTSTGYYGSYSQPVRYQYVYIPPVSSSENNEIKDKSLKLEKEKEKLEKEIRLLRKMLIHRVE